MDIKGLAEHLNISEDVARKFHSELFYLILQETKNPNLNTIHLQDLGKMYVKKITIDKVILAYMAQIRKGINIDRNKEKIRSLWEARKTKSYKRV